MNYIIKNATLVNEGKTTLASVVISGDKIENILVGRDAPWHVFTNYHVIDAEGLYLIPGRWGSSRNRRHHSIRCW